jgi:hypothetical protein
MPWKDKEHGKKRRHELYIQNRDERLANAKRYREENREKINESNGRRYHEKYRTDRLVNYDPAKRAAYHLANLEKERKQSFEYNRLVRIEVLSHYGGKCSFCGDSNLNHLSIDHINNDGAEHRRNGFKSGKLYRWLRDNNYPDGFQVLCFTHNFEKGHYGTMTPMEFDNA